MNNYIILIIGVVCAGFGGELFVRGSVGLAHWMRISPGIIGATVAAFATSSPELSVSINAALDGMPQIAFGDALGSNVVNIALILGLALIYSGIQGAPNSVKRDFPVALLVPVITGALLLDGVLSRIDGVVLLSLFLAWLGAAGREARKQRSAAEAVLGERQIGLIVISCAAGLGFLIAAGKLIVAGAREIALSFGIDEFIIGATVVAVGTSVPELATTVIAKLRGHDEVSLGTVLGSNVFNGLFIVAVAAVIHPIQIRLIEVAPALLFGLAAVTLILPTREGFIERRRGLFLLMLYIIYLFILLQQPFG